MPSSITDYLLQQGYTLNEERQRFENAQYYIPYSEITGTVDSFREKAIRKGWVQPKEWGTSRKIVVEDIQRKINLLVESLTPNVLLVKGGGFVVVPTNAFDAEGMEKPKAAQNRSRE